MFCNILANLSPLNIALNHGAFSLIKYYATHGMNIQNECHSSVLFNLVNNNYLDIVSYLIEQGVDMNVSTENYNIFLSMTLHFILPPAKDTIKWWHYS